MRELRKIVPLIAILVISISCSQQKKRSLRILLIGDSNTEIGNITMALKTLLNNKFGNYGSGYCTLNPNSMAATSDYLNIDKKVCSTALEELDPNKVVILLGTNDYGLDRRNPTDFKIKLKELIGRIKTALPEAEVLIVSPFSTDGEESKTILPIYVSKSFPEAAVETNSTYWDMNTWFGPWDREKLPDGVHVNEVYGKLIAAELFKHLK